MDTRRVATEYRLAQWAQIMKTRISRGQSVKDFCTIEGISKNVYFYWQRKLREAACTELTRQEPQVEKEIVPNGWTQLKTSDQMEKGISLTIEIGGCRVAVNSNTDPELLLKVCRALKSL